MHRFVVVRFLLVNTLLSQCAEGLVTEGSAVVPANGTVFLSKFVFDYHPRLPTVGILEVTIRSQEPIGDSTADTTDFTDRPHLVFFDDQAKSYPEASEEWSRLPCEAKVKHSVADYVFPVAFYNQTSGFTKAVTITERVRPRWWYVAIADCSGKSLSVHYDIHMVNNLRGWQKEFSIDHLGIYHMCKLALIFFSLQLAVQAWVTKKWEAEEFHPLVLMLLACIASLVLSLLCFLLHWHLFAKDGKGSIAVYTCGQFMRTVARFISMSMLMLMAKGIFISRHLTEMVIYETIGLVAPFTLLIFGLEAWADEATSRNYTSDFIYSTPLGYMSVALNVLLLIIFLRHAFLSYQREIDADKREFYTLCGWAYGLWFLVVPIEVVAAFCAPSWVRFRVDFVNSYIAQAGLTLSLLIGLWPDRKDSHLQRVMDVELRSISPDIHDDINGKDNETSIRGGVHWKPLPDQ
eukprot:TRINITY_DN49112_c0_g1_i1.p1 TRINITY_DN49112_c0_g1~~TRINITY_DN49112_c0_g1_i1.p1  ORF type:complete len:462 (+),score=44.57 TRINITY_DN49112_c0_g1_i1:46-1431(+)